MLHGAEVLPWDAPGDSTQHGWETSSFSSVMRPLYWPLPPEPWIMKYALKLTSSLNKQGLYSFCLLITERQACTTHPRFPHLSFSKSKLKIQLRPRHGGMRLVPESKLTHLPGDVIDRHFPFLQQVKLSWCSLQSQIIIYSKPCCDKRKQEIKLGVCHWHKTSWLST